MMRRRVLLFLGFAACGRTGAVAPQAPSAVPASPPEAAAVVAVAAPTETPKLDRIALPGIADGTSLQEFPENTILVDLDYGPIESYEGEWQNGLAHGEGMVRFRGEPRFGYMSTLPDPPDFYIGQFVAGRPVGDGKLVQHKFMTTRTITGIFSDLQIVFNVEGQDLGVLTRIPGTTRALVRAMQYPNWEHQQPSRIFFGEAENGKPHGAWVDVPWYMADDDQTIVGYGRLLEWSNKKGDTLSCKFQPRKPDPDDLASVVIGLSGNIEAQHVAALDWQYHTKAECVSRNREGWSWTATVDHTVWPPTVAYHGCKTPSGGTGVLTHGGTGCKVKKKHKFDPFTNIGREFRRFVNRRVLGTIDKVGAAVEKSMCRATGTEPGKNCHVNMSVSASWPVGDDPAPTLPTDQQAMRQTYLAAKRRAVGVPGTLGDMPLGIAAAAVADLDAVCVALCNSAAQREYSEILLSNIELVASQPANENTLRSIASLQRETASVLAAGIRGLTIATTIATPMFAVTRFIKSVKQASVIADAMSAINTNPSPNTLAYEKLRTRAMATLVALQGTQLNNAAIDGANMLGTAITTNIRILRGFSAQRRRAIQVAIQLGRTEAQVREFIERYQDIESEADLYDAIIKETLAPLGIAWPPPKQ